MKKRTRIISAISAAAVAVSALAVFATADSTYPNEYTVENVLSDYQYFVKGNLSAPPHTVGAVAVGGNATLGSWGDAQIAASYIEHIISSGNNPGGKWIDEEYNGKYREAKNTKVYYGTKDDCLNVDYLGDYEKNKGYIDFDKAFEKIAAQSEKMADIENAEVVTNEDIKGDWLKYVTVDLSKSKSYIIPYSIYTKVRRIDFVGINSADELATGGYTISFTDVNDKELNITTGYPSNDQVNISLNGGEDLNGGRLSNEFKEIAGGVQGGQMNLTGMNFILNFPDADEITCQYVTGHIVAPKADVNLLGGNLEGGIIVGGDLVTNGEGHFFPYYEPGERVSDEEIVVTTTVTTTTTPKPTTTTTTTSATTTTPKPTTTTTTTSATTTTPKPTTTTTTTSATTTTPKPTTTTTTTKATTTTPKPTTTTTTTKATTTTPKPTTTTTTTSATTTTPKPTTTTTTTSATTTTPVPTTTTSETTLIDAVEIVVTTTVVETTTTVTTTTPEATTTEEITTTLPETTTEQVTTTVPEEIIGEEETVVTTTEPPVTEEAVTTTFTEQIDETDQTRKVLGEKYEPETEDEVVDSDSIAKTGIKTGVTVAFLAGIVLVLAAVAGRKKLDEE